MSGTLRVKVDDYVLRGVGLEDLYVARYDDRNVPWAYESEAEFREQWPAGVAVVPLSATGANFYARLSNTMAALGPSDRVVVQLEEAVYHLTSFPLAGSSGDPQYAFGFWFGTKLQGLIGRGADKTIIQMDANSLSVAQLNRLSEYNSAAFAPIQLGLCRLDYVTGSPVLLAGITFQAADQQNLTATQPDVDMVVPQPAPHNGVQLYSGGYAESIVTYCRFRGAGRAATSAPPFECANIQSGRAKVIMDKCEFDGRRAPELDPARPRVCGPLMANGEASHLLTNSWLHHSNLSRYAVNDQSLAAPNGGGPYTVRNVQVDHISDNQNVNPALNGGKSLGGVSNPVMLGWESVGGIVTIENTIVHQDNRYPLSGSGTIPMHFMHSSAGSRNPRDGRMFVTDCVGVWPAHPHLNGFLGFRIYAATWWYKDGLATTLTVMSRGARLQPHIFNGAWPPTPAQLDAAGVTPETHYLVRTTN